MNAALMLVVFILGILVGVACTYYYGYLRWWQAGAKNEQDIHDKVWGPHAEEEQ